MDEHDVVIRGGFVIDGTGAPGRVGRRGHRRTAHHRGRLGRVEAGRRSPPTAGSVAPGWVDVHTHYDGQVTWDPYLTPSLVARGDHGRHGQLRGRFRAGASPTSTSG